MIRRILFFLLLPSLTFAQNLAKHVNPFIGTGGHGHTFPGATAPFGFCQLSPDTRIDGSWDGCGGYHYSDSIIYGFSHTHLSGTGVSDYGDILLMPVTKKMRLDNYDYKSSFSHNKEKAEAGYYEVYLNDPQVHVALTTSKRCGFHQYTYPKNADHYVVLDLAHRDELLDSRMDMVDKHTIRGYRFSKAWATNQKVFFEIKFEQEIDRILYEPIRKRSKTHAISLQKSPRALIRLKHSINSAKNTVHRNVKIKVGLSGVDMEGAKKNLKAEIPHWSFDKTRKKVQREWNKELGKIKIGSKTTGKRADETVIFYTALYHSMIAPNIYSDVDHRYRGRDDQIHSTDGTFDYYTVFSLWDTYRTLHPLLTIIDKKRTNDFINTFIRQYEEGGRLPVWELSSNETNCMIGYHVVSVIWDAYNKGIRGYDAEKALEAMVSIATEDSEALKSYMRYGYVRAEDDHESVSKTLEYAYNDWCIAQMANALGKKEEYLLFEKRSHNWMNVYDPTTGFMRARKNATLMQPFSPYLVDNNYTEANSWQYSFYVPHDVDQLVALHGGKKKFENKLDELFTAKKETEGRQQSDITGLIGQYAHGNEPSHHIVYLYHLIGKKDKGNELIKKIMRDFYTNSPDGYIGNEDCGQMSAWYVMNRMGAYPVCPGNSKYVTFKIDDTQISVDKSAYTFRNGIDAQIKEGANFYSRFHDVQQPQSSFKSSGAFVANPFIVKAERSFQDALEFEIQSPSGAPIYYRLGNAQTIVHGNSSLKLKINDDARLTFFAAKQDGGARIQYSPKQTTFFTKLPNDRKVYLNSKYSKTYHAGGPMGLVDGIYGKKNWRAGNWQGYQGQDFETVIHYTGDLEVSSLHANFLQDQRAWIFYPTEVSFYESKDSVQWNLVETVSLANRKGRDDDQISIYKVSTTKPLNGSSNGHYYKVTAKNYGALPEWHPGRGNPAYIFIDEIELK